MGRTDPTPPPDQDLGLAEELFGTVGLLRRRVRRSAGRPWPMASLTESQVELLRLVRRQPGTSVALAATELGLAANTVSTLVGQLSELGMLRRATARADRRVAQLTLTDAARKRIEAWRDRRTTLAAAALAELTADDRAALAEALPVLAKLADALRPPPENPQ